MFSVYTTSTQQSLAILNFFEFVFERMRPVISISPRKSLDPNFDDIVFENLRFQPSTRVR